MLDHWLLNQAMAAGAQVEEGCDVREAIVNDGRVAGVRVDGGVHRARLVIAADGRHSRLAFGLGLARHPARPRRWAIGAYFDTVEGVGDLGEMHVRAGHYIGVAPVTGTVCNVCLVLPHENGASGWRDAGAVLTASLARDGWLASRFARARLIAAPAVLGPMAVDVSASGVPGLLLAGDAAGFIDPMTGDGLTFALRGAAIAADVALDVLGGRIDPRRAAGELSARRRDAFAAKWRFNRALRRFVSSPHAVRAAARAARVLPGAFEALIRHAGDVGRRS